MTEEDDVAKVFRFNAGGIEVSYLEDFSSDIRFSAKVPETNEQPLIGHQAAAGRIEVRIPFEAIKEVVAEYVRMERIAALEDAGADDVLQGWV